MCVLAYVRIKRTNQLLANKKNIHIYPLQNREENERTRLYDIIEKTSNEHEFNASRGFARQLAYYTCHSNDNPIL